MVDSSVNESCAAENVFSVEQLTDDLAKTVMPVTIFIGVEALIGFIGNILILIVYAKWYVHCNFRYLVLNLAVYDLTSTVITLPGEMFSQLNWYTYEHAWVCKLKSYFNVFTAWGSAFTLLILAFDRYRKICRPLGWQIHPSFALKLCVCGISLAILVALPITILWGKQDYQYTVNGITFNVSICEKSTQYAEGQYPFIYIVCVYILPIGLMMLVISVCNVLIARKLFCKMFNQGLRAADLCSTVRRNVSATVTFNADETSTSIRRNTSETSNLSEVNTISSGLNRTLTYSSSLVSTEKITVKESSRSLKRRRSFVSLSAVSLKETALSRSNSVTVDLDHCSESSKDKKFSKHQTMPSHSGEQCGSSSKWSCSPVKSKNGERHLKASASLPALSTISRSDVRDTASLERDARPDRGSVNHKTKTLIMLVLTSVFIVTMTLYVILLTMVAMTDNILKKICNTEKVVFFFFWRIYFINCIVNPILYGLMDPRFRAGLKRIFRSCRLCKRRR